MEPDQPRPPRDGSDAQITIVVPVLARPHRVRPTLQSIQDSQREIPLAVLFVCSPDDHAERRELEAAGAPHLVVSWQPGHGDFARKIRYAADLTETPWLFQAADDLTFHHGWADHAIQTGQQTGAQVVGTQDSGNPQVKKGLHSTHTLISMGYIRDPGASLDGPGSVFSTAYRHQYVDTELVELAKARGVWAFSHRSLVTHHHPMWRDGHPMDDTYRKGLGDWREDHATFLERSVRWAGRPS